MMNEWDIQNARDEAVEEALQKGRQEGRTEIARKLLQKGLSVDAIVELTGLSSEEIATLQSK